MKLRMIGSALAGALAVSTLPAAAQPFTADAESYTAQARVVRVVPIREAVNVPRQECFSEPVDGSRNDQTAGAIIGGIAGGLIGHQIGSGRGNTAATIAGSVGGALAGNEIARRHNDGRDGRAIERCRTVSDDSERIVGYDVTYRFQGREFVSRLPYDPGSELPVQVTVAPAR